MQYPSWPAIGIVGAAALVLVLAGTPVLLAVAIAALWLAMLRPARPATAPIVALPDEGTVSSAAMAALIERFSLPLLMLDGQRVAAANAAAQAALGGHVIGEDARVALRHPEAVALLDAPQGTVTVRGLTAPRSIWQVSRMPIDARFSLIELVNRTAEADISRAHTDFVANASHELRTPLASIIGYIETLADPAAGVDAQTAARFHGIVLREARRLQTLVEDLMSLSRIEAEKHDPPRAPVDFALLAVTIAHTIGETAGANRIHAGGGQTGVIVTGDERQLDQLIRNLIDNALKYGDRAAPVEVAVRTAGANAVLEVRDAGEGIHPDHLPHLTRRFYRTDPGRSRGVGGTGLGLAIVKHIVERHRGRLDIASTLGVGTTVRVTLPLHVADQAPPLPLPEAAE